MIQRTEARRLSTKDEWSLVSSSLPPALEALSVARLKSKIVRARNLRQKYQDLYRRQKLSSKSRMTGTPYERLNVRTGRKKQMFDEAMIRLRLQLGKASAPAKASTGVPRRKVEQTSTPKVHSRAALKRADRRRQSLRDRAALSGSTRAVSKRTAEHKRRHSHVAASGRRRQAKRDSVSRQ
jgi:hypothetical protein